MSILSGPRGPPQTLPESLFLGSNPLRAPTQLGVRRFPFEGSPIEPAITVVGCLSSRPNSVPTPGCNMVKSLDEMVEFALVAAR